MLHRIRESLRDKNSSLLSNVVEVDEVYIGGKVKNMSNTKRASMRTANGGTESNKMMVIGMLERGRDLKLVVSGKNDTAQNIKPIMRENIEEDAFLITDSSGNYFGLNKEFAGHETVNHFNHEFVRNGVIHTIGVEGAFSLLKRSIIGIYHQLSPKHLSRYCNETEYRYNTRKMNDGERFELCLTQLTGRLPYKELIKDNGLTNETIIEPIFPKIDLNPKIYGRPIAQMLHGKIVAQYPSAVDAERVTGIKKRAISGVLRGINKSTGGYQWKYI